jgi:hypothetical protein
MAFVVAYSSLKKQRKAKSQEKIHNQIVLQEVEQNELLKQAFDELCKQTGIDHRKVMLGDAREKQKQKMKFYQDSLLEG